MIVIKEDRTVERIREQAERWKDHIRGTMDETTQDYITLMWAGYLNGLRISNAISGDEYKDLYDEMKEYVSGLELVRKGRKVVGL